ncbi:MAG: NIL domain-containing protein [Dehalococcoidales bacterium]|jgi:ferredoxin|nr:NIL domain-containing protein [Dehalococcoidales bacterium]
MATTKRIVLHFPKRLADRAIVYHLVKDFDLQFNILKASITPEEEGLMVLELTGKQADYDKGIQYLTETGVRIQSLGQNVLRNEERCTQCGVCITLCPTGAFELERPARRVVFQDEKCLACGLCIKACPPRAMELHF